MPEVELLIAYEKHKAETQGNRVLIRTLELYKMEEIG